MPDIEQAIAMTAKLYETRKAVKFLLGDKYPAKMAEWRHAIEQVAAARQVSDTKATILLCNQASKDGSSTVVAVILAAYVEMTEPSAGAAA